MRGQPLALLRDTQEHFSAKTKNLDLFDVDYLKGVLFNQGLIMRKMFDCKIENELNIIDCCYLQLMKNN